MKHPYRTDLLSDRLEVGPYETGCHTQHGNDLCLLVNMTPRLFQFKESVLANTARRESQWAMDFDSSPHPLLIDMELSLLLFMPLINKHCVDEGGSACEMKEDTFNDFLLWMLREYAAFKSEAFLAAQGLTA